MRHAWIALAVLVAACSSATDEPLTIDGYLTEWNDAWATADPYDVARFYDPDVDVKLAQGDLELRYQAGFTQDTTSGIGTAWLVRWMPGKVGPSTRTIEATAVADDSLATLVAFDDTAAFYELTPGPRGITAQRTLRWRDAHKETGEPDARLDWIEPVIGQFIGQWLEEGTGPLGSPRLMTIEVGGRSGPAIFVTPGLRTTAIVFFAATNECDVAVRLDVEDKSVVGERRWVSLDCIAIAPAWANALTMPKALGEQVTGTVGDVELYSASPEMERLVRWGLGRFEAIGAPELDSVTFAPVPDCEGVSGLTLDVQSSDIVLCTDAHAACLPGKATCSEFRTSVRLALLHELAHLWLRQQLDPDDRDAFTQFVGLGTWGDRDVPWHQRAVEHAAEIIAWGTMDESVELARIGSPTCSVRIDGFMLLTGNAPNTPCP